MRDNVVTPAAMARMDIGTSIAFVLKFNEGEPEVSTPVYQLIGTPEHMKTFPAGEFEGTLCRIDETGSGFVACTEVQAKHGADAYLHSTIIRNNGLEDGDRIAFDVHLNSYKQPQVSDPMWRLVAADPNKPPPDVPPAPPAPAEQAGNNNRGAKSKKSGGHGWSGKVSQIWGKKDGWSKKDGAKGKSKKG